MTEVLHLMDWQASASQRLEWLGEQLAIGAGADRPQPPPITRPASPGGGGGGSLLLAAGALLLVLAGIAFLAFTWRLLGPFGQISTLLLLGAGCLAAGARLLGRLHSTATALGLVGVFLIGIAALGTRVLGPDVIGDTGSLVVSVLVLAALGGAAIWVRPKSAPIGEIAAVTSAVLVIALLATAPLNDALPLDEPWTWWSAAICLAGGVSLLVAADRFGLRSWPWVAAFYLVVGSITAAAYVESLASDTVAPELEVVVFASTLVIASALVAALLRRTPHPWPVTIAVVSLWALAVLITWSSALSTALERPVAAVLLVIAGVVGVVPGLLVLRESWLRDAMVMVGLAAIGSAVGLAVVPWLDPQDDPAGAELWADLAWPAWRGLVAGIAFVAVLAASAVAVPRLKRRRNSARLNADVHCCVGAHRRGARHVAHRDPKRCRDGHHLLARELRAASSHTGRSDAPDRHRARGSLRRHAGCRAASSNRRLVGVARPCPGTTRGAARAVDADVRWVVAARALRSHVGTANSRRRVLVVVVAASLEHTHLADDRTCLRCRCRSVDAGALGRHFAALVV